MSQIIWIEISMCHWNRFVGLWVASTAFCSLLLSLHSFLPPPAPVSYYWCLWIFFFKRLLFCYLLKLCSWIVLIYLHVFLTCLVFCLSPSPLLNKDMKINTDSCYFCHVKIKASFENPVCPGFVSSLRCCLSVRLCPIPSCWLRTWIRITRVFVQWPFLSCRCGSLQNQTLLLCLVRVWETRPT